MDFWRFHQINELLTSEEWDVIQEALLEFIDSDRWDEFSYELASELYRQWSKF